MKLPRFFNRFRKARKQDLTPLLAGILRSTEPLQRAHDHFAGASIDSSNELLVSDGERARLRSWCKKEYLDNAYARNAARSFALATYGQGPSLSIQTSDEVLNAKLEKLFRKWREKVNLDWLWHVALNSLFYDGEAFFHFSENPHMPGGLGVELIEARRIKDDMGMGDPMSFEGITYDEWNVPVSYSVEREAINPMYQRVADYVEVPAERMIHFYLDDVTNQKRGLPLLQSCLDTLASLQRICRASLNAWELAAALNVIFKTSMEAQDLVRCLPPNTGVGETAVMPAFETLELPKDGGGMLMPSGVEPVQMKSEHPRDNFAANLQTFVTQVGLAVGEPRNIVSGDSSAYNYSSAQLDNEIFSRWGGTCQRQIQRALNKTLELCFAAHLHSDPAVSELFALIGDDDIPCVWYFPRMLESIDRLKDASADVALLNANLQTIREYCNRHGIDYEHHVKQMEAEKLLHPEGQV